MISLPASLVPRHTLTFSCGVFALLIDWHDQRKVVAAVLVFDSGRGYAKSVPTAFTEVLRFKFLGLNNPQVDTRPISRVAGV